MEKQPTTVGGVYRKAFTVERGADGKLSADSAKDALNRIADASVVYNKTKYRTIKGHASDMVKMFPLIVSDDIDRDTVSMVKKAIEKRYVQDLMLLLSSEIFNLNDYNTKSSRPLAVQILDKYHTNYEISALRPLAVQSKKSANNVKAGELVDVNLKTRLGSYQLIHSPQSIAAANRGFRESVEDLFDVEIDESGNLFLTTLPLLESDEEVKALHKHLEENLPHMMDVVEEGIYEDLRNGTFADLLSEGVFDKGKKALLRSRMSKSQRAEADAAETQKKAYSRSNAEVAEVKRDRGAFDPIMVTVTLQLKKSDGSIDQTGLKTTFGVLAVIHEIPTEEMTNVLKYFFTDKTLIRLIRWSKGELRTLKQMVGLDMMRRDFVVQKKSRRMWRSLEMIRHGGFIKRFFGEKKDPKLPNAHIMFSIKEIDEVKRFLNVDYLNDERLTMQFMERYFLYDFMVADDTNDMLYRFNYENGTYEYFPYNKLKSESKDKGQMDGAFIKEFVKAIKGGY